MDISKLLTQKESETLEFKESLRMKEEIGATVSAFSNISGGTILIGVTDRGAPKGLDIGKKTTTDLAEYIKKNTDPNIFPEIKVHDVEDREIISVAVKESHDKPVFFRGRVYKRVGDTSPKISSSEIRKLAKESWPKACWDEEICKGATLDDIDDEKVWWFLRKAKTERNLDIDPDTPTKDALKRLELMGERNPTNAAILLFGKNPQRFFLQSEARCGRFKGTKITGPFIDMKVIGGNLFDQIGEIEKFVLRNISKAAWVEPAKIERQEKWEYPPDAIREAVTNAVCHRDYESSANVQVRIFDDRIEIWNPGILPQPLTPADLKKQHESKPRNKHIAKCFFLTKFIEQWGTGTNKIVELSIKHGLPEPVFEETAGSFVVILGKEMSAEYLTEQGLNERQVKAVMYVRDRGRITNKQYQEINSVSRQTASRELSSLVQTGVLTQVGITGKSTFYELAQTPHKRPTNASKES